MAFKKVLVTGGCGFIGSNFIQLLLAERRDVSVVNLDALTYAGNPANLKEQEADPRYAFVRGDIADPEAVRRCLDRGADAVVNFAAESHVDRSILDASAFIRTNIQGTHVLLEAARERGVARYVQVSTDEVYGSLGPEGRFTEETPLAPNSPYSASKAAADLLVRAAFQTHGFPAVITRCSNNYGPYQFPEKLIPLCVSNALEDKPLPLYGDGKNVRDWLHVEDHCRALLAVLELGVPGEVYNIGGGTELPNVEVLRRILRLLGKPESLIAPVQDRPGHDRRYAIDSAKISRELGWRPRVSFDGGLKATLEWYRSHQAWLRSVRSGEYRRYYERQYGQRLS